MAQNNAVENSYLCVDGEIGRDSSPPPNRTPYHRGGSQSGPGVEAEKVQLQPYEGATKARACVLTQIHSGMLDLSSTPGFMNPKMASRDGKPKRTK